MANQEDIELIDVAPGAGGLNGEHDDRVDWYRFVRNQLALLCDIIKGFKPRFLLKSNGYLIVIVYSLLLSCGAGGLALFLDRHYSKQLRGPLSHFNSETMNVTFKRPNRYKNKFNEMDQYSEAIDNCTRMTLSLCCSGLFKMVCVILFCVFRCIAKKRNWNPNDTDLDFCLPAQILQWLLFVTFPWDIVLLPFLFFRLCTIPTEAVKIAIVRLLRNASERNVPGFSKLQIIFDCCGYSTIHGNIDTSLHPCDSNKNNCTDALTEVIFDLSTWIPLVFLLVMLAFFIAVCYNCIRQMRMLPNDIDAERA